MQVSVALLPQLLPNGGAIEYATAICIDTLRFTTTACQALAAGATGLQIAAEVEQARRLAKRSGEADSGHASLLCGERECQPIPGFDLGNSPFEYQPSVVADRHLVFSTTNGTRAVAAAQDSREIWLGALVNRRAVCQRLRSTAPSQVWLVCAGTDGVVALEDVLTAGAILADLEEPPANDAGFLAKLAWRQVQATTQELPAGALDGENLERALWQQFEMADGGRNLVETGYSNDLRFAARLDTLDIVPCNGSAWDVFVRGQ